MTDLLDGNLGMLFYVGDRSVGWLLWDAIFSRISHLATVDVVCVKLRLFLTAKISQFCNERESCSLAAQSYGCLLSEVYSEVSTVPLCSMVLTHRKVCTGLQSYPILKH